MNPDDSYRAFLLYKQLPDVIGGFAHNPLPSWDTENEPGDPFPVVVEDEGESYDPDDLATHDPVQPPTMMQLLAEEGIPEFDPQSFLDQPAPVAGVDQTDDPTQFVDMSQGETFAEVFAAEPTTRLWLTNEIERQAVDLGMDPGQAASLSRLLLGDVEGGGGGVLGLGVADLTPVGLWNDFQEAMLRAGKTLNPTSVMDGIDAGSAAMNLGIAAVQAIPVPFAAFKFLQRFQKYVEDVADGVIVPGALAVRSVDDTGKTVPTSEVLEGAKEAPIQTLKGPDVNLPVWEGAGTEFAKREALTAARADTRMGADHVRDRLPVIVPQGERVRGGTYVAGAPGGGKWSDLGEDALNARGIGFTGTDGDLQRIWEESISEVSQAGRQAVENTGATWQAFDATRWDKALRLPARSQLWYELSGEKFVDNLPDLTDDEFMMFVDLIGATSARAKPGENLQRGLAVLSQRLSGGPVDTDIMAQGATRDALQRRGSDPTSDLKNKTGNFSNTLAIVAGKPVTYPISVNDTWVAQAFGIDDKALMGNQALHEVFAKYMNKMRDLVNGGIGHNSGAIPHESWHLQARQWVEIRAADDGIDTLTDAFSGSDYAGEWDNVVTKLEAAGIPVPDGVITRDILMHPDFADSLRTTVPAFRDAPKATIEFGSLLHPEGREAARLYESAKEAGDLLTQKEYQGVFTSEMYHSARGKGTIWERAARQATGRSDKVTRIYSPTKKDPFAISGTFEGSAAPNIRIPLKDMTPDQIGYFNALVGSGLKQKAMAAVEMNRIASPAAMPEGTLATASVRFDINGPVPEALLTDFTQALGEGFEVSVMRWPDGIIMDIVPKDGTVVPTAAQVDAAVAAIEATHNISNPKIFSTAFRSEYGKHYVDDPGDQTVHKQILKDNLGGLTDAAVTEIKDLTGGASTVAEIRNFLAGGGDLAITSSRLPEGVTLSSVKGRAGTIRKRLRTRVDNHHSLAREFEGMGDRIKAKQKELTPKWQKREAKRNGN